jgi:hypothetical protein
MIAFSCTWNIGCQGENVYLLFLLWEDRVCKVCQSEVEMEHHFLISCEAYSSLCENFLNYLECDPNNEADLN